MNKVEFDAERERAREINRILKEHGYNAAVIRSGLPHDFIEEIGISDEVFNEITERLSKHNGEPISLKRLMEIAGETKLLSREECIIMGVIITHAHYHQSGIESFVKGVDQG